jgi:AcrR family transcriptional regulator
VVARQKESRRPGERAGLTTEAVLATARRLIHEHGPDGLSMRRIAAELGVLPNTLYSHVADKQALLDALVDQLLGEVRVPPGRGWRARAIGLLQATRATLLSEPTLAMLYVQRAGRGPNAIRLAQQGLQISAEAFRVMIAFTVGFVAFELGRSSAGRSAAPLPPLPPELNLEGPAQPPGDAEFNLGLEWLMDGVATRVQD